MLSTQSMGSGSSHEALLCICTSKARGQLLLTCLQVERRDAGDPAGWDSTSELTFILMMEVLDNCPHDRVP